VGEFQRAHGLPDDGVVGPSTLKALNDALAAESSSG
jgi:murein L,D-transpeptidase YcbB/YkuD